HQRAREVAVSPRRRPPLAAGSEHTHAGQRYTHLVNTPIRHTFSKPELLSPRGRSTGASVARTVSLVPRPRFRAAPERAWRPAAADTRMQLSGRTHRHAAQRAPGARSARLECLIGQV